VLRIDIDMAGEIPVYGLGKGTDLPVGDDADIKDLNRLLSRIDSALRGSIFRPKVRIAAHGELPYDTVEQVMKELDTLRRLRQIEDYHIEVNERVAR
jgi:hypothetical protein